MNKQITNFGHKLSVADMKKLQGGGPAVGGTGTGAARCEQLDPCMAVYIQGGEGCCRTCCTRTCLMQQQSDPVCFYV